MQQENLVIVESPAKAKTIEKFLGSNYLVKSSFGHIRDLSKKGLGVDIKDNFKPEYIVSNDKQDVVRDLKKLAKSAKTIWLASDEDREGEAIAWHLQEALGLSDKNTNRIVFHEITKDAILNAIKNPRKVDINLVNAQQARRILDRLVGFEISPVLWKKVKNSLSAGRVQSVAVRLVVEREREIIAFQVSSFYKVVGNFITEGAKSIKAELNKRFEKKEDVSKFLEHCKTASFSIESVEKKPGKKSPSAPFTTSTLQQEASRKFGFSVKQTMSIAQHLYEAGLITYMRTDSTNLSDSAIRSAKQVISKLYGANYSQERKYKTKSKGAQEAHEAIRPTYIENQGIEGTAQEKKLYELIWKRTIASQMSDASLERTLVNIAISKAVSKFQAEGEVLLFDGFLRVYMETQEDESEDKKETILLPAIKQGENLSYKSILATERFSQKPPRYSEAGLVKKMEELGIGRPSTYAPTISTILQREYVNKEDRQGVERTYLQLELNKGKDIEVFSKKEITGAEKAKLFPTDIGILVNDFLTENFKNIVDYNFTAKIEEQFDEIATGNLVWNEMLSKFYKPFHADLEKTIDNTEYTNTERVLGIDPKSGRTVSVRLGKFGPLAQMSPLDDKGKPSYAGLQRGQLLETITLEEALRLFDLPRKIGDYEGVEMFAAIGRFGPYVRFGSEFVSMKKDVDDPYSITEERAVELIEEKRKKDREKLIKDFGEIKILNGRWGPYISSNNENYKIPKDIDAHLLTIEKCKQLIAEQDTKTKTTKKSAKSKDSKEGKSKTKKK